MLQMLLLNSTGFEPRVPIASFMYLHHDFGK